MKASTDNIILQKGEVQSNGQTLYWESYGEGKPFVLVMGIGYDSTLWGLHQVPFFLSISRQLFLTTGMLDVVQKPLKHIQ